jgi:hypothetical protein
MRYSRTRTKGRKQTRVLHLAWIVVLAIIVLALVSALFIK